MMIPPKISATIPVIGIAAFSGTGKTTLIEKLLPLLAGQGLRTGVVKASHHRIEPDPPGKDSYRLRHAGASQLVLSMPGRSLCYTEYPNGYERQLQEQLQLLNQDQLDLILVEGFREAPIAKIELHRSDYDKPFLFTEDPHIIAIAWDGNPGINLPGHLAELDINSPKHIASFIENYCHEK
ncbi:molybdopterin-guanine dinucleotide biosynthesis protein B [Endozoicomonas sp. GU-1]|uniref:molybdopterin-guanine dinucleotide biosynthesis protein B n=1 Tax=Endozoicomonas sp. GU-1 TaxID=3009078 RepID=UPI0022B2D11C|nr:molybdopterin-guanine dinucleotide biosynthesis protein B [Endozoicomonas sp. GU-1]WBA80779.1 molybdopterin-guanine dinucleotide biosynthesis protein B [Endozoicomonas sp. GU-1]WBA88343.1 molybdopterin-guanine dinucleotide biosynthesis protein B [Endozoicomonas sp. GU-1]